MWQPQTPTSTGVLYCDSDPTGSVACSPWSSSFSFRTVLCMAGQPASLALTLQMPVMPLKCPCEFPKCPLGSSSISIKNHTCGGVTGLNLNLTQGKGSPWGSLSKLDSLAEPPYSKMGDNMSFLWRNVWGWSDLMHAAANMVTQHPVSPQYLLVLLSQRGKLVLQRAS